MRSLGDVLASLRGRDAEKGILSRDAGDWQKFDGAFPDAVWVSDPEGAAWYETIEARYARSRGFFACITLDHVRRFSYSFSPSGGST